jgi:hypothetical protein
MPTLARLLLASACLLIAPLVVMADELPKDTDKIESLTVEQAQRLVTEFKGTWLYLNGLTTLSADAAKALAQHKGGLSLNGLTTLSDEAATALAQHKGDLSLTGLTTLDADAAKALAQYKGWLFLNGLNTLDAEAATALAQHKGELHLNGLTTLDAEAATALTQHKGTLSLCKWGSLVRTNLTPDSALAFAELLGGDLSAVTALDSPDSVAIAKALAQYKGWLFLGLTTLDAEAATALAQHKGRLSLDGLTTLSDEAAKAIAGFEGDGLYLHGLDRASFGAVRALRKNPRVEMPNHWYLLRYDIAALVGTVLFLVLAGFAVWYIRRQSDAD